MIQAGKLYVVATPIGNLEDITLRAKRILSDADFILAEDTRRTKVLLTELKAVNKIISYHKFNEKARIEFIIEELFTGKNAALVSDAGTPCISDPGYILIEQAVKEGIEIIPIAGACALTSSLSVSGFNINSFSFYGFPPRETNKLFKFLSNILNCTQKIIVLYESPKRIINLLEMIIDVFNNPEICLCNDLTKKFEKIYRGTADSVLSELKENSNHEKGEYTIIINKNNTKEKKDLKTKNKLEVLLAEIIIKEKCSIKDAVNKLSYENKIMYKKNEIYEASIKLKEILQSVL